MNLNREVSPPVGGAGGKLFAENAARLVALLERPIGLLVLLAVATAVRGWWWAQNAFVIENEGAEYATLARNLLEGAGYTGILGGPHTLHPPLYPALIALVAWVLGDFESAGRAVSFVGGLVTVWGLYAVAVEMFDRRVAFVTGGLAACHPLLASLSSSVFSESLAFAFVVLGLLAAIRAAHRGAASCYIASGASFGLAYLVRPECVVFLACALGFVSAWSAARHRRLGAALRPAVLMLMPAFLLALPYVTYLSVRSGEFHWEGKSEANAWLARRLRQGMSFDEANRGLGASPDQSGPYLEPDQFAIMRRESGSTAEGLREALRDPLTRVVAIGRQLLTSASLGFPALAIFALVGVIGPLPHGVRRLAVWMLLACCGALLVVLLSIEHTYERYLYPVLVFLLPAAGRGLLRVAEFLEWAFTRATLRGSAALLGLACAGLAALVMLGAAYRATIWAPELGDDAGELHLKRAGLWILASPVPHPVVATYSSVIPFYAAGVLRYLPYAPESEALHYLHEVGADFIAISSRDFRRTPYVESWYRDGISDNCAERVATVEGGATVAIWRWRCSPEKAPSHHGAGARQAE